MSTPVLKDKVPPHNIEAELATIGAILLDSDALIVVLRYLRAPDFYKYANQKLFEAIIRLTDKGETPDLITLTDDLRTNNELDKVGGAGYISQITSSVPTSANVEYYAKLVQDCSIRRILLKISSEIASNAFSETNEAREIVEDAERRIFEITDQQASGSYKSAKEVVNETINAIEKRHAHTGEYTGVPAGYTDLDDMTSGFQKSEMIIIGARPSVGKTAFALNVASNIAINHGISTGFFTLEMSAQALMQRLLAAEARINSHSLRTGILTNADFDAMTDAAGRIYEAPLFIEDTPNMKLLDLRAQARRMKSKQDIQIIIIDYLTLIGAENTSIPRHEQIAEISRSLKSLARELDIPVIALSQVSRASEGKPPSLADLRESGSIEQDADVVMFLHRDRGIEKGTGDIDGIETELIVAKQRNGPVGTVKLTFVPRYTKFESFTNQA